MSIKVTIEGASWGEIVTQMEEFVGRADYTPPQPLQAVESQSSQTGTNMPAEPPHPVEAFKPFVAAAESWPPGQCPKHLRPWKAGKFGPFCSAKDDTTSTGFCALKPGDIWNGKNIPLVPTVAVAG